MFLRFKLRLPAKQCLVRTCNCTFTWDLACLVIAKAETKYVEGVKSSATLERWIFETTTAVIMALQWVRPPCDLHKYFISATFLIKSFLAGCRHQAHSQQVARDMYGSHFIFCPNTPIVFHENTQDPILRIKIHKSEKYHMLGDRLVVSLLRPSGWSFTFNLIHFKQSVGNKRWISTELSFSGWQWQTIAIWKNAVTWSCRLTVKEC